MDSLIHPFKVWNIDGLAQREEHTYQTHCGPHLHARVSDFGFAFAFWRSSSSSSSHSIRIFRYGLDARSMPEVLLFKFRVRFRFQLLLAWSRSFRIIRNEFLSKLNQSFGSRLIVCRTVVAAARAASHWDEMLMLMVMVMAREWEIVIWCSYCLLVRLLAR